MHKIISSSLVLGLSVVTLAGAGCTSAPVATNTNTTNVNVTKNTNITPTNTNTVTNTANTNVVSNDITANLGKDFTVNVGQTALVGEEVEVQVTQVSNDSRCPEGTQCITAGTVSVVLSLAANGKDLGTTTVTGTGSSEEPAVQTVGDYKVTVGDVSPAPVSGATFAQEDYTVTLSVGK